MVQSRLNVVIVGGGIGGLFAANALAAQGFAVAVYEQAPVIGEIGAGVFLTPNSVRHLQRIGLQPAVEIALGVVRIDSEVEIPVLVDMDRTVCADGERMARQKALDTFKQSLRA